ncbi:MAG: tRNA guanosine(34) transglycosylase Tgt [Silvanigrellales bacterium]|nr:tRNA guanosine(34) transglycosylase Tgt [Silvanigrellales bacterium]
MTSFPHRSLAVFSRDASFSLPLPPRGFDKTPLCTGDLRLADLWREFENQEAKRSSSEDAPEATDVEQVGPRLGTLRFGDIVVETPTFMPVGTVGSVKALSPHDVHDIGYRLILGNTYHLNLRPGVEVLERFGGLHRFMGWPGALLTDSGGFQVMSLAKIRKLDEQGVSFANHLNGGKVVLTPESVVGIQDTIDSDIQMVLDECTPFPATHDEARASMERSMRWARRAREGRSARTRAQFGIVQGGMYGDLRARSARALRELDFEGLAVGGLSVGEPKAEMRRVLAATVPHLPHDKPRYLMGVGAPDDLFDGALLGIDMFDCVMPTRNARNGTVFVRTAVNPTGKLHVKNAVHKDAEIPLDPGCRCYTCRHFSRAYLRHLFVAEELLVHRLLTIHSLTLLFDLMAEFREALRFDKPWEALLDVRARYVGTSSPAAKV